MPGKYHTDELVIVKGRGEARIDDYNVSEKTYRVCYNKTSFEWVKETDVSLPG